MSDKIPAFSELAAAEAEKDRPARKRCVLILGVLAVLAVPLALFFVVLWALTVWACIQTYFLSAGGPAATGPRSFLRWLIDLDLSSSAALILFLLCYLLARNGVRLAIHLPRAHGAMFWVRAYRGTLFPSSFWRLCLDVGLVGALASFVLASVTLMKEMEARQTAAVAVAEEAAGNAAEEAGAGNLRGGAGGGGPFATRILLVVFASLTGAFVGAFVAFIIVPPLEALTRRALGQHLLRGADEEEASQRLAQEVTGLVNRIAQLGPLFESLESWLPQLRGGNVLIANLEERLRGIAEGLHGITDAFSQGSKALQGAGTSLGTTADKIDRLLASLATLLPSVEGATRSLQQLADASSQGQRGMATLSEQVRNLLGLVSQGLQNVLAVVKPVGEVLTLITRGQGEQQRILQEMNDACRKVESNLRAFAEGLNLQVRGTIEAAHADLLAAFDSRQERLEAEVVAVRQAMNDFRKDQAAQRAMLEEVVAALVSLSSVHEPMPRLAALNGQRRRWWRRWLAGAGVVLVAALAVLAVALARPGKEILP